MTDQAEVTSLSDPFTVPEGPDQVGVLDIGSNSIRFVVYDIYGSHFTPVYNEKVLAGLGRGLKETGCLSKDGKRSALAALKRFQSILNARGLEHLHIGATAAMREADDAPDFIAEIEKTTGMKVMPISGEEEARLSALGLLAGDPDAVGIGADLGGASLELMRVENGEPGERLSLLLGPFEAIGSDLRGADYEALIPEIDKALSELPPSLSSTDTLFLIGGAWRKLAAIEMGRTLYPLKTLQSYALDPLDAARLAKWAYTNGKEQLFDWPGTRVERAETLPYSGLLLSRLIEAIRPSRIVVSLTGLREGLVFDGLPDEARARDTLLDGCRDFATGLLQSEYFGQPLMAFVERVSDILPEAFGPEIDQRLRRASCLLAGLGKNLHPDYRAEMVFEDVLYAPIAGLDHPQRVWLALTLFRSISRTKSSPNQRAVEMLLTQDQIFAADVLGELIRLAIVATGRTPELIGCFHLTREGSTLILRSEDPALLTDQVEFRLSRLASKMSLEYAMTSA